MIPDHTDFSVMLARWARERPDATAITFGDTRRSWSQLAVRVQGVVAAMRAAGLQPGGRIAVLDLNHPSCLELPLACAQIGTANAVVNYGHRLKSALRQTSRADEGQNEMAQTERVQKILMHCLGQSFKPQW